MKIIGQFAKENNVTVKTLHHYEKLGLITPTKVDPNTGYRYYSDEDSLDLRITLFMKDLGFSLSEIKDVINNQYENKSLIEFMTFKMKQSEKDLESTSKRLFKLDKIISILKNEQSSKIKFKELISMIEKELFTGNYGRGKFIEESEKAFNKAKQENTPLSIIQMDFDYFHKLNQTFGYDIGDIVLQRTQDEIMNVLHESKHTSLMERKGGDEFSIIVDASPLEASKLATMILNRTTSIDYSDIADNMKVSITAGIAGLRKRTNSYSDLMHDAIIKLYEAKRNRR